MSDARVPAEHAAPARLADFARDYYHCADCSYCVDASWAERGIDHVCPTIEHHLPLAGWSGRGYLLAARAWFEGMAVDEDELASRVFTCTGCGNCEALCPIGLRPAQIGAALRETLVSRGHAPDAVEQVRASMRAHGNPYGRPAPSRADWAHGLAFADTGATLLYAPGCAAAWMAPGEAAAQVRVMQAAGERVAWRGAADRCCGAPLREAGFADEAAEAEARLATSVAALPLVTAGHECVPAWRRTLGATPAKSFPIWLADALRTGRLMARVTPGLRVYAFDGCAARRPGDAAVADPLREILTLLGVEPVNDARGAAHAVCCGAAGTMRAVEPDAARRMAAARLAPRQQADVVVASDARCRAHLADAVQEHDAPVQGLAEFLLEHARLEAAR